VRLRDVPSPVSSRLLPTVPRSRLGTAPADASARILADDPAPPPPSGDPADTSEIGRLAVWSVTSAKPGNGVELLRDGNLDTYWQSDGAQPHLVNVQFQRKVKVREIALYADYKLDESYTPSKISVRAGNSFHDLREVCVVDLDEPVGWTRVRLDANGGGETEMDAEGGAPLRAYFLQLAVLSNHQNGRDTHVRQVKIFGPRQSPMAMLGNGVSFTTTEFAQFATVR
jgi:anaphase-promoting complex subunit 10